MLSGTSTLSHCPSPLCQIRERGRLPESAVFNSSSPMPRLWRQGTPADGKDRSVFEDAGHFTEGPRYGNSGLARDAAIFTVTRTHLGSFMAYAEDSRDRAIPPLLVPRVVSG